MRCPFLREAQVKYCAASDVRKMIVRLPGQALAERCTSPSHEGCPYLRQHQLDGPESEHCPFLHEQLMQFCAAAPVVKYIPYTDSTQSRCATSGHRYCDLFAAMSGGGSCAASAGTGGGNTDSDTLPRNLWYSPNHMWIEPSTDRLCHVGVDAFFTNVLESIDAITFVTRRGRCLPEVRFVSAGSELRMVFPNPLLVTDVNTYLRTDPSKLLRDPYVSGWLFEGLDIGGAGEDQASPLTAGLIPGRDVESWLRHETAEMNETVHELASRAGGMVTMADGGRYRDHFFPSLDRAGRSLVYERFFSPGRRGGGPR